MSSPESDRPYSVPSDPLLDLRRDMIVWAEPVIADRIWEAYRDRRVAAASRSIVAVHHRRLWRALILHKFGLAQQIRGDLVRDLAQAGLSGEAMAEIDNDVMEELMDIVFRRFRSSREVAKGFSLVLLAAASNIGASRPLAA
jgi:hypothetical protein